MADISQFTSKFRLGPSTSAGSAGSTSFAGDNKVAKRNRQPLSCQICRVRKLKCDRGHPCENCVKRGEGDACQYGRHAATDTAGASRESTTRTNGLNGASSGGKNGAANGAVGGRAQDRLRQLEEMVRQMLDEKEGMARQSSETSGKVHSRSSDPTQPSSRAGAANPVRSIEQAESDGEEKLTRSRHATNYTGSTHWSAIFDQINDLRECLVQQLPQDELTPLSPTSTATSESHSYQYPTTIFCAPQPLPLPELLQQYLPPRRQLDRLLSTYFNAQYTTLLVVHTQQFAKQYEAFQADPLGTSPIWISLLFSVMCTADMIQYASSPDSASWRSSSQERSPGTSSHGYSSASSPGDPSLASPNRDRYLSAASQCLLLGNYTRPQAHLIEALAMFAQCKYALTIDPSRETTMIFALLARLAYTMSYHRDCDNFAAGQFTPFEAEMRRRVWHAIKMFDVMISFQLGIPRNIAEGSADTRPPRYLLDTDFDEDSKQLPREREKTEPSAMLYFVSKIKLMEMFGKAISYALSFHKPVDEIQKREEKAKVTELDAEIRKAAEEIPLILRTKPMSLSFSDPGYLIMVRSNLMFVVHKCLCVLHRKFMINNRPWDSKAASYSRTVVLDSSTRMVTHFLDLHSEMQPGGQLYNDRWMMSSFKINDFSLAVMILCFVFWNERKKALGAGRGKSEAQIDREWLQSDSQSRKTYDLLVQARDVGSEYGKRGMEAKRVSEILTAVLKKIAVPGDVRPANTTGPQRPASNFAEQDQNGHDSLNLSPLSISGYQAGTTIADSMSSHLSPQTGPTTADSSSSSHVYEHAPGSWIHDSGIPPTKATEHTLDPFQDPMYIPDAQSQSQSQSQPQPHPSNQWTMVYNDLETQTLTTWAPDANIPIFINTAAGPNDPNDPNDPINWASFDQFLGTYGSTTPMTGLQSHLQPHQYQHQHQQPVDSSVQMDVDGTHGINGFDGLNSGNAKIDDGVCGEQGRHTVNNGLLGNWAGW